MLKLDTDRSCEAQWYNMEADEAVTEPEGDAPFLLIAPEPLSEANTIIRDGCLVISGQDQCRTFKNSLKDMRNIVGSDDKPLPCTDAVKQKIFDFRLGGIAEYVISKVYEVRARQAADDRD